MDRANRHMEQHSHGALRPVIEDKAALGINPVKRELLNNALVTIADNVMVMIVRTARSANVKNSLDFSAAILDADGQLVAQGLAVPVHLGSMMPAIKGCLDYFGDDVADGDMLVCNDPYSGCSHLNDVYMFKPVFAGARRIAWIGIVLHHSDLGGRVAGGTRGREWRRSRKHARRLRLLCAGQHARARIR